MSNLDIKRKESRNVWRMWQHIWMFQDAVWQHGCDMKRLTTHGCDMKRLTTHGCDMKCVTTWMWLDGQCENGTCEQCHCDHCDLAAVGFTIKSTSQSANQTLLENDTCKTIHALCILSTDGTWYTPVFLSVTSSRLPLNLCNRRSWKNKEIKKGYNNKNA